MLMLAVKHNVKTIAFSAISCGVYGYPIDLAVIIAVRETVCFLKQHPEIETVHFCCFDKTIYDAYQQALSELKHDE